VAALGCLVQSGPAVVVRLRSACANQTRIIREQAAQHSYIASGTCLKEVGNERFLTLLDFRFQSAPTREAVVARYRQQSGGQLGVRVSPTQLLQSVFCKLFQVLQRRAFGEL
jgi:hypothetical protein